jgi:2-furoate---CoA ligase
LIGPAPEGAGAHDFEQLIAGSGAAEPPGTVGPEDLGLLLYTSGTTGVPKGVPITHEMSVFRVLANLNHGIAHCEPLRTLGLMPLYHTVGCHSQALMSLVFGGTYYPVRAFDPAETVDVVEREQINVLFGSPTHFSMILNHPSFSKHKFSSVRHALYAGAPMATPLVERVSREVTENLTHIYGNTETYMGGWYRRTAERPQMLRVGIWHDVRIVKPAGTLDALAELGREGELIINMRSPESFRGYYNKPDKTAEVCVDGWYHTGDSARWVEEGVYEITGRIDDMIISGAENIHPAEVESYLATHPKIADVCVVGVPDETWGQIVKAFVVRRDQDLTEGDLEQYCKSSKVLEAWKRPRAYCFVPSLPRTPSGKVQRFLLRQKN